MKPTGVEHRYWLLILALSLLILVGPVSAQSQPVNPQDRNSSLTRQQLAGLDQFFDKHPEIAEQLRKDPSLVKNAEWVESHPDLQRFLQANPQVREEMTENPRAVLGQEQRFDRREDAGRDRDQDRDRDRSRNPQGDNDAPRRDNDVTRNELAAMDRFMDSHPETAEQLRKNPALINNREFVESHAALQQFLASHPELREEFRENPQAFMHQEQRFDRREDMQAVDRRSESDRDLTRSDLASMDRFMDSHPEIAEQLRKNPALVNDKQFLENHPALQQFLANHPQLREEYRENPSAFMQQEQRFDRREDSGMRRDPSVASFHQFLESNQKIAGELSKNPSLANNQEFLENHPALRDYLNANPKVHEQLSQNPQSFVTMAQPSGKPKDAPTVPAMEPKK